MSKLYYLPVEKYRSRWSQYVSGEEGMFAHCVADANRSIELVAIAPDDIVHEIEDGVVLDTGLRANWCFKQIAELLELIKTGIITSESVIYLEDFWTVGFECIPYACHLKGIRPKVYAFWHAQTADENDFSFGMRSWMRFVEAGWAEWLTGIFVAAKEMKQMMISAKVPGTDRALVSANKIHVTGTVFRREDLMQYVGKNKTEARLDNLVFASRFDKEKDPDFFCEVANAVCLNTPWLIDVVSGRSIPVEYRERLQAIDDHRHAIRLHENVEKARYFSLLARAKVSFNCAKQDFVGYTTLDSLSMGCQPLLPRYLTFPDVVGNNPDYLYEPGNLDDAMNHLAILMANEVPDLRLTETPEIYQRFGSKYESSVARMLDVMFSQPSLGSIIAEERAREADAV